MQGVTPIKYIKKWNNINEIINFCEHIISHSERYEKERVFEAKEILSNIKQEVEKSERIKIYINGKCNRV